MGQTAPTNQWVTFTLDNAWNVEFPVASGGVLCLGPGKIRIAARLRQAFRAEDGWYTVLICDLRVADADGALWQAKGFFTSDGLISSVVDRARREPARWLRNAPPEWVTALEQRSLFKSAVSTYDDRFYRYFWVDNTAFCWQFKYLAATFDLAQFSEDRLIVRVGEVFCSWNRLQVTDPEGNPLPVEPRRELTEEEEEEESDRLGESGEEGDYDTMQPLVYLLGAGRLLFCNTARQLEDNAWATRSINQVLVFEKSAEKGDGQRVVRHRTGHLIPARDLAPALDEPGFHPMTMPNWSTVDLPTDQGGWLRLEGNRIGCIVKLDRHPNSTGPEDVLRCRTRLTDASGTLWEGVAHFTPDLFFEKLIDLERGDLINFESEDELWQPAPDDLTGIRTRLEGEWRYLLLASDMVAFRVGELTPTLTLRPTEGGFVLRFTGLVGRRRPVVNDDHYTELDPEDRADEVAGWEQDQPLPPIQVSVGLCDVAFHNTTFAVDDGFWHGNPIPIPVVFTAIGFTAIGTELTNELVRYVEAK